ncbi:MAG: hypothetical protein M3065_14460, partial [Actinomycetota bacterium]|nr:hypothetical protein [Actinomycetota bacterium]
MTACRDYSCTCGSGAAYEVCCLERDTSLHRLVAELEATVGALGRAIWDEHRDWYEVRFGELYDGGIAAFGPAGPGAEARLDAELWFLLDCPLDTGDTPLHRIRQRASGRAVELLARSELRAWRIESVDGPGLFGALCPLGTGRARLETVRRPLGSVTPGAILVARSVPIGPGRWGLLGRAPVVDREAMGDFDAVLAWLNSPRGEFWRVHGGVLARAAWAWPEDREHTRDGQIVSGSLSTFAVLDVGAVVAALRSDGELAFSDAGGESRDGEVELWDAKVEGDGPVLRWNWRWDPPRARLVRNEPGVRYTLCDEDACAQPFLARIVVDLEVPEVCLLAPTPSRLALAERLLAARLGDALGDRTLHEVDPQSIVPRWKRAAFERELVAVA